MRNLIVSVAAMAFLAACGPSGKELATAKTARYHGDKLVLFTTAKAATEAKYKLEVSDETKLGLKTIARWYTPEGVASNWTPADSAGTTGKQRGLPDRSVSISLVVQLLPEADRWVVHVEPIVLRYFEGRPNFDPVPPNDPSMPGFVQGKVDQLAFEIYNSLKQYAVQSPGGVAPAPAAEPAAAPAAPEPTPAAEPVADPAAPAPAPTPTP